MALPFLKWVGGKRQLIPVIQVEFPTVYKTFYEGFTGGAALTFEMCPPSCVLNDFNSELTTCYRVIKKNPRPLMERLRELATHEDRTKLYYKLRAIDPNTLDDVEKAARMIYLNKNGFNGLYRVNKNGKFNVPVGKFKTPPSLFDEENMLACHDVLQRATILTGDFEAACSTATEGDLVYFDPPYVPLNPTSAFTSYTADGFGKKEQERLAALVKTLYQRRVSVVVSNSDTPLVRELYSDFEIKTVQAKRSINSKAKLRGAVPEVLVVGVYHS